MKTKWNPGENLVQSGPANLQRGIETVGGDLYLTDKRLIFVPHQLNIQKEELTLNLIEVEAVQFAWTKFLGVLPVFPNSLVVTLKNEVGYSFVLEGRKNWQTEIIRLTNLITEQTK